MSKQLNISSLAIGYHNNILIKDINIITNKNQLIGIFGRNGKGKSTFLKTLAGLLPPINGQFIYEDVNVLNLSEKQRSKVLSIVSSNQTDIGRIKVKDFVAFGRYPYTNWLGIESETDKTKINKAINFCNIDYLINRDYDALSDGEKQKVNIARAIAQDTPLIILDEPTVHLDLINKVEILKLLKELVEKHDKTIIFSTHQIEFALQICDEIWLFNDTVEAFNTTQIINNKKFNSLFSNENLIFDKANLTFKLL